MVSFVFWQVVFDTIRDDYLRTLKCWREPA